MGIRWKNKDPADVADYSIDWSDRIGGDAITSVTWTIPAGITQVSQAAPSGAVTSLFLSGGVNGTIYSIGCRIVTAGGLTLNERVRLKVRAR